jgi:hypothetical protein
MRMYVYETIGNNFKDTTFLRGIIVTLSMHPNCQQIIGKYKQRYNISFQEEITENCESRYTINYLLEPLVKKGVIQINK